MKTTEISTITLKNASNQAILDLVKAEVTRRPHLRDGLVGFTEGANEINFQVKDEGVMQHLANALSLDKPIEQVMRLIGKAYGRTGAVGTIAVTVWYIEY